MLLIVVYGSLLLFDLAYMHIIWDETPHLLGGLYLSQGRLGDYLALTRYPPLFDVVTAGFFKVFSASVLAGRLVSVTFGLLTLGVVFKLASRSFGHRVGFISCVFTATMSGFLWLSRVTLLEMALEFFFVTAILLFADWWHTGKDRFILLSGVALGLVFLTKYHGLVAGLVILASLPFMIYHNEFKPKISRFLLLIAATALIVVPVIAFTYFSGTLGQWLHFLWGSDASTNMYSARFPQPIFYLIELTQPLDFVHPISILVLILGLHGLALFAWRRKAMDKMFLVWFVVIYVFFTLIGTKSWRYIMPLAPVIAISAAGFVMFLYGKLEITWRSVRSSSDKKLMAKICAGLLIAFSAVALVSSAVDAYSWIAKDASYPFPLPQAIHYTASGLTGNESVMVICANNVLSLDIANFYLQAYELKTNAAYQYPILPVDASTTNFNITELVNMCKQRDTKFLLFYENRDRPYFNSTQTVQTVNDMINASGKFNAPTIFGDAPRRLWVFEVNATAMQT